MHHYKQDLQRDDSGFVVRSLARDSRLVIGSGDAILHVDIQTAFMTDHIRNGEFVRGGGLGVPGAHNVVDVALHNTLFFRDEQRYCSIDRHPNGHVGDVNSYVDLAPFKNLTLDMVRAWPDDSFIASPHLSREYLLFYLARTPDNEQTLWPRHALADTEQAELYPAMRQLGYRQMLVKGDHPQCDSYSPFFDNVGLPTGLGVTMRHAGVQRLFIDGIAYNVCAGRAALDARRELGFETFIIKDATRSVQIPGLEAKMDADLLAAGVHIITSDMLAAE